MSLNKKILFFLQFSATFTGQRIATKLIFDLLSSYADVELINLSAKQESIKKVWRVKLFFIYIQKYMQLIKKLKTCEYDYVYVVFAPSKPALLKDYLSAFVITKYNKKARLVTHLHCGNYGENFKQGIFKSLFSHLIKKVDTFIFLSPVLNTIKGLPDDKVFYLNNTISEEVICTDDEVDKKLMFKQSRKVLNIYFISNMIKEKGYNDLISAAGILNKEGNINFKVHLI